MNKASKCSQEWTKNTPDWSHFSDQKYEANATITFLPELQKYRYLILSNQSWVLSQEGEKLYEPLPSGQIIKKFKSFFHKCTSCLVFSFFLSPFNTLENFPPLFIG